MRARKHKSKDHVVVRTEGNLKKDRSGEQYGLITILKHIGFNRRDKSVYLVQDIFGCESTVSANQIVQKYFGKRLLTKESRNKCKKLCACYYNMLRRCYDPECSKYSYYGGRKIKVCSDWLSNIGKIEFIKWAVSNGYQYGLTIDRIDTNKHYTPDNCRWVSKTINCRHTSRTKLSLDAVTKIREEFHKTPRDKKNGFFAAQVKKYGCSLSNIKCICYKENRWVQ